MTDLKKEWEILHADNEKYERYSLIIKLACILTSVLLIVFSPSLILSVLLVFVFWGQEAIWKTFQERLCDRILLLEKALTSDSQALPDSYQFYSQWIENRAGAVGTIKEYAMTAIKPTVMYPYIIVLFLVLLF